MNGARVSLKQGIVGFQSGHYVTQAAPTYGRRKL